MSGKCINGIIILCQSEAGGENSRWGRGSCYSQAHVSGFHTKCFRIEFDSIFVLNLPSLQLLREVGDANQGSADSGIGTNLGIDVCDNRFSPKYLVVC